MKRILIAAATLAMLSISASAFAAPTPAQTAQQNLMKTCNADATKQGLKGEARKTFMKTCLSAKPATTATTTTTATPPVTAATATPTKPTQQELMKTCNADATKQGLKGDARKTFMSTCLSGKSTTPTTTGLVAPVTTAGPVATMPAGQFATEADAKKHCPTDLVVWLNTDAKIYHFAGTSDYGKTKTGVYICQKDADAAGDHAAKNEKPPATH